MPAQIGDPLWWMADQGVKELENTSLVGTGVHSKLNRWAAKTW